MSSKPKILKLANIDHAKDDWSSLTEIGDTLEFTSGDRALFLKECAAGKFDGVVAIYRSFESVGPVDGELLDALPSTCKFICHNGAGYDQIDVEACTSRKICVSNTPTAVNDATADMAMFLLLGTLRNLPASMASLRRGEWRGKTALPLGRDPRGRILGILGMGGIGRNMAQKARAFGMKIRYHNRNRLSPESEEGAEYVDFKTLLGESDVLSLNLPLNPATRHTISRDQFAMMKRGIVVINTARGAVMDEAALVDALADGTVASAGLDVFEDEPNVHPGLLSNDQVLLVPHMGTYTSDTEEKMEKWAIGNVRKAVAEGKLKSIVPEQLSLEKELGEKA